MDTDAAEKFKRQVEIDGIEHASFRITKMMYQKYSPSQETALQFVLEELEAASQGNQKSKNFVNNRKSNFFRSLLIIAVIVGIIFFIATSGKFIFPQLMQIFKIGLPFITKFIGI